MTRYQGDNPTYDEPASEADSYSYETAEPKPAGVITGTTRVELAAGVTARPSSGQQLCRWIAPDQFPRSLALIVTVKGSAGNTAADPFAQEIVQFGQVSGASGGSVVEPAGVLRVTYGQGSALRLIDADLRGGSYHLPPCTTCTVEAFAFGTGPLGPIEVAASVVPGQVETPARFVHSFKTTLAAAATATAKVPFGARWVAMLGGNPTNVGVGQPILSLKQGSSGPFLLHNYVDSVFLSTPGQPVELANRDDIVITNLGGSTVSVTVRFLLET